MLANGKTLGLALSGGGFRATLFGLGSLWRLNELGLLRSLDRISSVSGGSILAGFLGHKWKTLVFSDGVASNFGEEIAAPLRKFCSQTIDITAGLAGILTPFRSTGEVLAARYDKDLFHKGTLRDLPIGPGSVRAATGPDFVIYATNMQTGRSFRFSQDYLADWNLGVNRAAVVSLAEAVAASSAFPPVFSPIEIKTNPEDWKDAKLQHDNLVDFQRKIVLTDGGVYDNMGMEALLGNVDIVLVSDAGAPFEVDRSPWSNYVSQLGRVRDILIDQTRSLRKRWFVQELVAKRQAGAYWGIGTRISDYQLAGLTTDSPMTESLQSVRTRLNKFADEEQGRLINWGYALADAAIRKYVMPDAQAAMHWPVPGFPL